MVIYRPYDYPSPTQTPSIRSTLPQRKMELESNSNWKQIQKRTTRITLLVDLYARLVD